MRTLVAAGVLLLTASADAGAQCSLEQDPNRVCGSFTPFTYVRNSSGTTVQAGVWFVGRPNPSVTVRVAPRTRAPIGCPPLGSFVQVTSCQPVAASRARRR